MLAEMLRSGSGRSILEAQILQEKTLERLLAIARGEDVPELKPQPDGEAEEATDAEDDAKGDAAEASDE